MSCNWEREVRWSDEGGHGHGSGGDYGSGSLTTYMGMDALDFVEQATPSLILLIFDEWD